MSINTLYAEVAALLNAVEQEMLGLSLWSELSPTLEALASQQPFCVDTLSFPQWLQFVFLPRMRELIEVGGELPANCQIAPMAEMYFADGGTGRKHAELIKRLAAVDACLNRPR